ncbi:D-aminoacyl-tRNA deacylase [Streptomyces hundungensis]|uniref:D-aminoacyl-tRNA deacylase n=1 Tax=Streptomyces hundungensis TaxID=1077946 RepID=A0A387HCD9_9ACTN|nr:D-aminoacyl-tRNA deacylase [Streptomyces hundungensis]
MRAVVQRVDGARVVVAGETVGEITGEGLCVLVGVTHEDTPDKAAQLARKLWSVRILEGEKSCSDVNAPLLVISQFTLYGDARKGRRPTWNAAAPARWRSPWSTRWWPNSGRWAPRWRRAGSARTCGCRSPTTARSRSSSTSEPHGPAPGRMSEPHGSAPGPAQGRTTSSIRPYGSTTTSWAAAVFPASSSASTGTFRLTRASAIGPSS